MELTKLPKQIQYIEGNIPVLFLAGHAHNHRRPNLTGVMKQGETWTEYIANNVAQATGAHSIYINADVDFDPNYHKLEKNPFKQLAAEVVEKNKIKYVFDLHGLKDSHQFDIGLFYLKQFRNSKYLSYALARELANGPIDDAIFQIFNFKDNYFGNGNMETLIRFLVRKYKIAGVQMEIAQYIRDDESLREGLIKEFIGFVRGL